MAEEKTAGAAELIVYPRGPQASGFLFSENIFVSGYKKIVTVRFIG
jgi:hypothetical protein